MEIYSPAEDSFFLSEVLEKEVLKLSNKKAEIKVLDMGSGSGVQAETCVSNGIAPINLTLADINKRAIKHLKIKFPVSKIVHSDLFEKIKGKFNLIIFNPPYLPSSKFDKEKDTTGGKKGDEVIVRFLRQLKNHLAINGKAYLLLSSFTPMNRIKKEFNNYNAGLIAKKKLFFEELFVWELTISN